MSNLSVVKHKLSSEFSSTLYFKKLKISSVEETLRCVIPVVCVTNDREESVVNQHNLFRKMLYSDNETTCFGL